MKFDKKHRPQTLADVVYADAAVEQALNDYAHNQRDKHLLLLRPKRHWQVGVCTACPQRAHGNLGPNGPDRHLERQGLSSCARHF